MPKNDVSFTSALESRTRGIYVDLLRDNPALTLGELQQLCWGEFGKVLSTITLGELFAGGKVTRTASTPSTPTGRGAKAPTKAAKANPAAKTPAAPVAEKSAPGSSTAEDINTRTPAGRQAFDEAVFAAIKAIVSPAGAGAIQRVTGGTNMQVRSACNRLIEAGRVSWRGKARGTRYQVA